MRNRCGRAGRAVILVCAVFAMQRAAAHPSDTAARVSLRDRFRMPKFSWIGRTGRGQTVSGNMDACSKDEVVARLSATQIVVPNVTEIGTRGEPEDPDRLVRSTRPAA